jgi:aldehyde dehydrogenase (NAD+)
VTADSPALARLLTPANVVIVGAKDSSPSSYGVIEALRRVGFQGRIFAVNRSAKPAHGLAAVSSCVAIGEPVDAAVLLVPASAVDEVLDDVAEAGIRTAVIMSSGWAEAGPAGIAGQRALADRARGLGLTLIGPNCLGFMNVAARTGAWIASLSPTVRPRPVAIVSQSGGVGNALCDLAAEFDVGLSCVVTTGNEAMLTTTDVLEYLVEDERTRSVAMFTEVISAPSRFLAAASRARELGKAIVMLKAGRSANAARNAMTHTGSLVGDDRVIGAALRQAGAVRVRSLEELIITADVIARAGPLRPHGIAVVSGSGGSIDIVADEADRLGLDLPPFDELAAEEIRAVLPGFAAVQNPLDITGGALGDEFEKVLAIVDRQDAFGAVAVLCNVPSYDSCKVPTISRLLATISRGLGSIAKPGFLLSQSIAHLNETGREAVRSAGATGLPGLSLGIAALAHLSWWSKQLSQEARPDHPPALLRTSGPCTPGLGGIVSEWSARELLEPAGVPFVPAGLARSPGEAAELAAGFAGPVAIKLVSPDVPHKTDVGAVRLGVTGAAAVRRAFGDVLAAGTAARAGLRVEGVQISPMRRGGVELLFVRPHGTERIEVVNPATEEVAGSVPRALAADMDSAVAAARRAFDETDWPHRPPAERAEVLLAVAKGLQDRNDEIAHIITAENGGLFRHTVMTVGHRHCVYYAGLSSRVAWEELRTGGVGPAVLRREPAGVAALVVPWNAPIGLLMVKLAPALLAGCTVVAKPAPETPLDTYPLAEVLRDAGLPAGVVNIVPADAIAGDHLVSHPGVDSVSLTGSVRAGKRIMQVCADRLARVHLELGGKSASIMLDDAPLDEAVRGTLGGFLINNGQACAALTRTLVPAHRYAEVVERLAAAAAAATVGDPYDDTAELGPLTSRKQYERVTGYIELGQAEGARVVTGGARPDGFDRGFYVAPTVFDRVTNDMRIAREEIFGPVNCVIPYDTVDEAVAIANDSEYGLSGAVWSADVERAMQVARKIRTGTFTLNGFTLDSQIPFGGYKASGIGRQNGLEGLDAFVELKAVHMTTQQAAALGYQ